MPTGSQGTALSSRPSLPRALGGCRAAAAARALTRHKSWPGCADNTVQITAPAGPAHPKRSASSQILLCWCWLPAPRPEGSGGRGSARRSTVRAELWHRLTATGLGVCPFQCQDLVSQTSSPLSQNDSCTGRSADLLLPSGDTGKRQHERGSEVAPYSRVDRYKAQVSACFRASCGPSARLSAGSPSSGASEELG